MKIKAFNRAITSARVQREQKERCKQQNSWKSKPPIKLPSLKEGK